jgi:hypothetical protein
METTTTAARKRTRNRKRMNDSSDVSGGVLSVGRTNRGRKKRSDTTKKVEGKEKKKDKEIITKPVIESTNPFFIAVCAPETYKPRVSATSGGEQQHRDAKGGVVGVGEERKPNVFLRHRNRNSMNHNNHNNNYPNRFIHHPLLQQSRELDSVDVGVNPQIETTNVSVELSNEELFPSLGKSSVVGCMASKLNFKEMVLRNASPMSPMASTATATATATPTVPTRCEKNVSSQKSISTGNIFLAAFQQNSYADAHADDDYDDAVMGEKESSYHKPPVYSSSLIDSCDKKYDRLYSS